MLEIPAKFFICPVMLTMGNVGAYAVEGEGRNLGFLRKLIL